MEFANTVIKNKKHKFLLLLFFSLLIIGSFIILNVSGYSIFLVTIFTLGLFGLIISLFLAVRFYTWPIFAFMVVILGIFFRRQHWPFASILMAIGTAFLAFICLYNALKINSVFRDRTFLKWFGGLTGIIVSLFMTGLLFMNQHWSGVARAILIYSGCFLFILTVLAMVFTLPFSNYVTWTEIERRVFYRTILIPMVCIFGFFILVFIFPDYYNSLMGRYVNTAPWIYADTQIQLFTLEGIPLN
jgi:hypothetical protein